MLLNAYYSQNYASIMCQGLVVWPKLDQSGRSHHCIHSPTHSDSAHLQGSEQNHERNMNLVLNNQLLVYSLMFYTLPRGHSAWFSGKDI